MLTSGFSTQPAMNVMFIVLVLCVSATVGFKNPVVKDEVSSDPSILLHNNIYYVVTSTNKDSPNQLPIRFSSDLQNWEILGYVITEENKPTWPDGAIYKTPEIVKRDDGKFIVYFTVEYVLGYTAIGVAHASKIGGPYKVLDEPLTIGLDSNIEDPAVIQTNDGLFLMYSRQGIFFGNRYNKDGMTELDMIRTNFLKTDQPWEGTTINSPSFATKDGYIYVFYSGNCTTPAKCNIGVARSFSPFGPYEKLAKPVVVANENWNPASASVIPDKDSKNGDYLLVFDAYSKNDTTQSRFMNVNTLTWMDNGWPTVSP